MSESVILVLGVSGSGKTCLIRRIQDPDTQDFGSVETVGAQPSKVGNFTFLEVGGQLLPLWHTYAQDAKGIMYASVEFHDIYFHSSFVLDVKKTNQIAEAAMAVLDLKATCSIVSITCRQQNLLALFSLLYFTSDQRHHFVMHVCIEQRFVFPSSISF